MSDEFLELARQEIQTEIDGLKHVFSKCTNDEQLYNKSKHIERHMHKIKGLAPMMGQVEIGEIARISDIILKHVIKHGMLKSSHGIIWDAVKRMDGLFNEMKSEEIDSFRKKATGTYPDITGF
jgi:chemotaxis protein histidine kinase CheA